MEYTRLLKKGSQGEDVKYIKTLLFKLGYYRPNIKAITSNKFGADTVDAVKNFQTKFPETGTKGKPDGEIGKKTWKKIQEEYDKRKPSPSTDGILKNYTHIAADKRKKIEEDLAKVSELRIDIVKEILKYAYDASVGGPVKGLYIFGANLYNNQLKINYADAAEVERASKAHPEYFNGGRKAWMLEQIKNNPYIPASDCSGMEVGYMKVRGLVKSTFDTTANSLCSDNYSKAVAKTALKSGDWVGKAGHIGTYVGGGYVVEFAGGAYGCQITELNNRRMYDFIQKKVVKGAPWTKYCRPKMY